SAPQRRRAARDLGAHRRRSCGEARRRVDCPSTRYLFHRDREAAVRAPALEKYLPAALCFAATPALSIELEADLSTHQVDIRTNFQGAEIMVFGAVTDRPAGADEPTDLIVVIRGAPETVEVRRKSRVGVIWANADNFTARNVPSFYAIASTKPLDEIADTAS